MKNSSFFLVIFLGIFLCFSCQRNDDIGPTQTDIPVSSYLKSGVWIVNEGVYGFGNGDFSFISLLENKIYNSCFYAANGFFPGDVPFSILIDDDNVIVSINNSSKVFVLSRKDFKLTHSIGNISQPRQLLKLKKNSYVVSVFAGDSIYFIDYVNSEYHVEGMYAGKSTESLLYNGKYVFAANWSMYGGNYANNTIMCIDPEQRQVVALLSVGKEPNSMCIDTDSNLWVLCSGGYLNEEFPRLIKINHSSLQTDTTFIFSDIHSSPFALTIDKKRKNMYFINKDVFKMSFTDTKLPEHSWFNAGQRNFYSLHAGIDDNMILVTDAKNYQVSGEILFLDTLAVLKNVFQTGINPGQIVKNE